MMASEGVECVTHGEELGVDACVNKTSDFKGRGNCEITFCFPMKKGKTECSLLQHEDRAPLTLSTVLILI